MRIDGPSNDSRDAVLDEIWDIVLWVSKHLANSPGELMNVSDLGDEEQIRERLALAKNAMPEDLELD